MAKYVLNYSHTTARRKAQVTRTYTRKDADTCARACVGVCLAKPYIPHFLVALFNAWKVLQYLNWCPLACTSSIGQYQPATCYFGIFLNGPNSNRVVEFIPNSYTYLTFEKLIGLIPFIYIEERVYMK